MLWDLSNASLLLTTNRSYHAFSRGTTALTSRGFENIEKSEESKEVAMPGRDSDKLAEN